MPSPDIFPVVHAAKSERLLTASYVRYFGNFPVYSALVIQQALAVSRFVEHGFAHFIIAAVSTKALLGAVTSGGPRLLTQAGPSSTRAFMISAFPRLMKTIDTRGVAVGPEGMRVR
jgi:hypothetical protein